MIMNKLKVVFLVLVLTVPLFLKAQITTEPALPVATQKVTITFNSSEETRLGYFTGDLYAHTGVGIEGKGDWQNIVGGGDSWGKNDVQPKLTHKGNGIYELEITPDINSFYSVASGEKVINMSFVFRSADKSQQTNDLFVSYEQRFGETHEKDMVKYEVKLEYELFRFLFLELNNSSRASGFDVILKFDAK